MEQKPQISLQTATYYLLPKEELRELYLRMAMSQYRFLRVPDYNEVALLKQLSRDIRKMLAEAQSLNQQFPNNHYLSRICSFIDLHHKQLLQLV